MAKKARKKADIPAEQRRRKVTMPAGYKAIPPTGFGDFWNPTAGDELYGTLAGMAKVNEDDRYTLLTNEGELLTLPNHYELVQLLSAGVQERGGSPVGLEVWIAFEGYEPANVKGGKMARYSVAFKQ